MYTLVLLRHGESQWNKDNRFTGWADVDLTEKGIQEAQLAGTLLRDGGFTFDVIYTSTLKRAIRTSHIVQEQMDLLWLPLHRFWQLNERHYGALQGLDKAETAKKYGNQQVKIWRRSYSTPPPLLDLDDKRHPRHDIRYQHLSPEQLPSTECLADTVKRILPIWQHTIAPEILKGQRVLIGAHGNSLRALVMHLDGISETDILEVNIPTGIPLVYELDKALKPISRRYLGDLDVVKQAELNIAQQGRTDGV